MNDPTPPKKRKMEEEDEEMPSNGVQVDLSRTQELAGPSSTVAMVPGPREMDSKLRELLLSSPAHLFGHQPPPIQPGANPQAAVTSWENWLCVLATNLSPAQWQGYWLAHSALFGEQAVPIHMLSFFQGQISPSSSSSPSSSTIQLGPHPNDPIHERYGEKLKFVS
uniref:Uncharacterized protein n=1 Tax=Caenorhabditis tropicalis TaxID=1561998 RepID=A0A1I7TKW8_9PELO